MGLPKEGAPIDRLIGRAKGMIRQIRPMPVAAVALAALLLSMSTFAVLNFTDFQEHPPSGRIDVPDADASGFRVMAGGLVDTDRSGIPDALQNFIYGTDPGRWNTSGTPLPDGWLINHGYDALDPAIDRQPAARPHSDELPAAYGNKWPARFTPSLWEIYSWERPDDWDEVEDGPWQNGLDPRRWDNSGDGIPDGWLLHFGLDPLDSDLGGLRLAGDEGLTLREAFEHNTNPHMLDTAGSGIPDREEIEGPVNPRYPEVGPPRFPPTDPSMFSTTKSGVCDGYLVAHGLDPTDPENSYRDLARSGATTVQKFEWSHERYGEAACTEGRGLDPRAQSTIGGPIPDGWLLRYGLDPLDPDVHEKETQSTEEIQSEPQPWDPMLEAPDQPVLPHVTLTVLDEYEQGRPMDWDESERGPWWGGTDPTKPDTDGDGLPDSVEIRGFYITVATDVGPSAELKHHHVSSDPTRVSTSGDALTDWEEIVELGTDPTKRDTAMDGIPDVRYLDEDFQEYGLSPIHADTPGDFLRDGERLALLESRSSQYATGDLSYPFPGEPGIARKVTDWACALPGAQTSFAGMEDGDADCEDLLGPQQLAELFGPMGDINGNGVPNIRDPDISGDSLLNGWEIHPSLYRHSSYPSPIARSATDPLNPDTDGDGLLDGWEVEYARPLHDMGRYSLDHARWSTLCDLGEDCGSDADQDFVDNGAHWPIVENRPGGQIEVRIDTFEFTNLLEQQYETDPHVFDSAGDGLADGWKVFWGIVYPVLDPDDQGDVRPSQIPQALRPIPNVPQENVVLAQGSVTHFFLDNSHARPGDLVEAFPNIPLADGTEGTVYRVTKTIEFTYQDAQAAGTNPYLAAEGTLGDGIPDWWKWYYRELPEGIPPELGECDPGLAIDPLDGELAERDLDGDGLTLKQEFLLGTNPYCRSSTLTGIQDRMMAGLEQGQEVGDQHRKNALDPERARGFLEAQVDLDCDGLFDHEELVGLRYGDLFGDQVIRTSPDLPDTSGSGLLDGKNVFMQRSSSEPCSGTAWVDLFIDLGISYRRTGDTYRFNAEIDQQTHPLNLDDTGTGIPTGWFVSHNLNPHGLQHPRSHYWDRYSLGMPSWWDHAAHGPWWGGLPPGASNDELQQYQQDADQDGLLDIDGEDGFEDPMPGANWENDWRELPWDTYPPELGLGPPPEGTHPADPNLDPLVRRLLAQSYLNPREVGSSFVSFPRHELETPPRIQPCIDFDRSTGLRDAQDNPINEITKGETAYMVGRVVESCGAGNPVGIHGVTVEVRRSGHSFGATFTKSDGAFRLPVNIGTEQSVHLPDDVPVVLRGQTGGTVNWTTDPSLIPAGAQFLDLRTYASPDYSPVRPALSSAPVETNSFTVLADSELTLKAPEAVVTGGTFPVEFELRDSGGAPLDDPVRFTWDGKKQTVTPDPQGRGEVRLEARHAMQGVQTLVAESLPSTSPRQYVEAAEVTKTIRLRQPVDVDIQSAPESIDAGSTLRVEGRVLFQGQGVSGAQVMVNLTGGPRPIEGAHAQTGPTGTYVATLIVPPDAAGGPHVLTATVQETDSTVEVETSAELDVRGLPVFFDVSVGNITQGDPVQVEGRLLEPDGRPIPEAKILVRLHSTEQTITTDTAGRFSAQVPSVLPARPVQQILEFGGDDLRVPVTHRSERAVLATTTIEMAGGILARGGDLETSIRLLDGAGAGVEGATLRVTWGKEPPVTIKTGPSGQATFHRAGQANDPVGPVALRAEYAGSRDGGRAPVTSVVGWTVMTQAEIVLPEGNFEAGTPLPMALLRDAGTREPLAGQAVTVESDSIGDLEARTDPDGRFPVMEGINRTSPPRVFEVTAKYPGNESYNPVQAHAVMVIQTPVHMDIHAPTHIVMGREVLIPVRVMGLDGRLVPDGQMDVTLGDQIVGRSHVEEGSARIPVVIPENATAGSTSLRFTYHNSSLYAPAESAEPVHLLRSVTLTFIIDEAKSGETATIRVRAESAGEPVPFIPVHLQMEGNEGGLVGETNEEGIATFHVEQPPGSVRMAARFPGEDQLHPTHVLGVLQPPPPMGPLEKGTVMLTWILLASAIVLAGLLPVIYRLRRSPLEPVMRRARRILTDRGPDAERILLAYRELDEAAIGQGMLLGIAQTARILQTAVEPHVPSDAHPSLDRLVSLFELARYGTDPVGPQERKEAVAAFDEILKSMRKQTGFTFSWTLRRKKPEVATG